MLRLSKTKILILLGERGLTITELAEQIGMQQTNLSSILSRATCKPATAGKIAGALGVSIHAILEDE